ncbi:MAG: hypothetical protein WCY88_12600 [Spongiibacteraceae bacterium]
MAGDKDKEDDKTSVDLIQTVEKRVGSNRILVIAVLIISVSLVAVMTTGMIVMFSRIATLEAAAAANQENQMEKKFSELDEQLMLLADFRRSELKKIVAYTQQIEDVRNDCRMEKAVPYQEFLSSREQDFSQLVSSVKVGATNLAAMNTGSKAWLDDYTKILDGLVLSSSERKKKLDNLLEGLSDD